MSQNIIKYGDIDISMPDETFNCFWMFEDLAERFGVEYQSEAVSLLKSELKNRIDIKPKPSIDYEADNTHIQSRSADTIFKAVKIVNQLSISKLQATLSDEESEAILAQLMAWKRPKKKKWQVGDVFSMKLKDGSFMFGQVIGRQTMDIQVFKSPTCAIFELRKATAQVSDTELKDSRVIATHNTSSEYLDKGIFSMLFGIEPLTTSDSVDQYSTIGGQHLTDLGNAYYGLEPWNVWGREDWFDKMLCTGISRPKTALILKADARNKYRLEIFGVDENNEYVNKRRTE